MPDLLFELGVEELPASFVAKAFKDLEEGILSRLKEAGISHGPSQSLGTPRRLIVHVQDVGARQPDVAREMRGPSLTAAYDAEGHPTKALEGFCRGQGVDPSAVRKDTEYVWITQNTVGKPTQEVLKDILPSAVKGLTFEKSMRWGQNRMRFARPIRWMLASFGGALVEFEVEGVPSGLMSRGHRFDFPDPFEAKDFDTLMNELLTRHVEPDPAEREKRIREGATIIATGKPHLTDALVDENTYLTEWPTPIEGTFRAEFLDLPGPVLTTAMAKHQRMFPVRDGNGKLTNKFISIRNSGDDGVVREGNEWVLNARFNDAQFFFEEDKRHDLAYFLDKTNGMLFQEKLGTVRQRADRLAKLAVAVATATGADEMEEAYAMKAGLYSKADLSCGLVSELPSLQGVIGGEYARRENWDDPICWAMASHYDLAKNPSVDCVGARIAVRLLIADQLDKLVGYLGLGLEPTGSSDPFGLRRAATMLIEAGLRWPSRFDGYDALVEKSAALYEGHEFDPSTIRARLQALFSSRYGVTFDSARYDIVEAATGEDLDVQAMRFRVEALSQVTGDAVFLQTASRPLNIVSAARKKNEQMDIAVDELAGKLDSREGETLLAETISVSPKVSSAAAAMDAKGLIESLRQLTIPINAFFDSTMVMADDLAIRRARLSLLLAVCKQLRLAGDFTKLVIDGS